MKMDLYKRWGIFQATIIVVFIIGLKLLVEYFSFEYVHLSILVICVIVGGLCGIAILSSTITNYRKNKELPLEIALALQNINEQALFIKKLKGKFNLVLFQEKLHALLKTIGKDLAEPNSREALAQVSSLSESFLEMEKLGVPTSYIILLKHQQGVIRRQLFYIYQSLSNQFLPTVYFFIKSIVFFVITLLIFTQIDPIIHNELIIIALGSYLGILVIKFLGVISVPFPVDELSKLRLIK